jgi:hypothetical protein
MCRLVFLVCALIVCAPSTAKAQVIGFPLQSFEWLWQEPAVSAEGSIHIRYWVNVWIAREGLSRLSNKDREKLVGAKDGLVPLSRVPHLDVSKHLDPSKRYLHPWASDGLAEIAAIYKEDTAADLPLNSALRTVEQQTSILPRRVKKGKRWVWVGNMNAIPPSGPLGSAHPFGNTVDLARLRMPDWYEPIFETKLLALEKHRCLDVTKESGQAVYHVTFFKQCETGTIASVLSQTQ